MSNQFKLSDYDETIRIVLESGGEFRMYPRGFSMLPLIRQGKDSVILVKPQGDLKKNDIPFYKRDNGTYVLHRVVKAENGNYTVCGDNQTWLETGVNNSHIIGVVSRIYRGDKVITENSPGYKIYLFVWQFFIVRRVFFKLRKLGMKLRRRKNGS